MNGILLLLFLTVSDIHPKLFHVGVLLPELAIDLLLLQSRMPDQVSKLSEITSLNALLNVLDEFNLLASDTSKEDESDMTWPEGII